MKRRIVSLSNNCNDSGVNAKSKSKKKEKKPSKERLPKENPKKKRKTIPHKKGKEKDTPASAARKVEDLIEDLQDESEEPFSVSDLANFVWPDEDWEDESLALKEEEEKKEESYDEYEPPCFSLRADGWKEVARNLSKGPNWGFVGGEYAAKTKFNGRLSMIDVINLSRTCKYFLIMLNLEYELLWYRFFPDAKCGVYLSATRNNKISQKKERTLKVTFTEKRIQICLECSRCRSIVPGSDRDNLVACEKVGDKLEANAAKKAETAETAYTKNWILNHSGVIRNKTWAQSRKTKTWNSTIIDKTMCQCTCEDDSHCVDMRRFNRAKYEERLSRKKAAIMAKAKRQIEELEKAERKSAGLDIREPMQGEGLPRSMPVKRNEDGKLIFDPCASSKVADEREDEGEDEEGEEKSEERKEEEEEGKDEPYDEEEE